MATEPAHLLISNRRDPWLNLAAEEYLLRLADREEGLPALVFYVNSPCVVVGRNNRLSEWVWVEKVRQRNLPLIRRISGGGTVVHHEDNLNYGLILPRDLIPDLTPKAIQNEVLSLVITCLSRLGISAERGGISDLMVVGRKVGGSGLWISRRTALFHGTLLFMSRVELMEEVLPVPPNRDQNLAHRDFVAGLVELGHPVMMEDVMVEMVAEVERRYRLSLSPLEFDDQLAGEVQPILEEIRRRSEQP